MSETWRPLLSGAAQEQALAMARDIAGSWREAHLRDVSLGTGRGGLVMLLAYAAEVWPDDGFDEAAVGALEQLLGDVSNLWLDPHSLFYGVTGIGWLVAHLGASVMEADADTYAPFDGAVLELLRTHPRLNPISLLEGAVGLGVYGLARRDDAAGPGCVEGALARLAACAREESGGLCWWSGPDLVGWAHRGEFSDGNFDLGMARGLGGVIAFLAFAHGVSTRAAPLLDGAVAWLLAQRMPGTEPAFPTLVGSGGRREAHRRAWCYGDPGLAGALLAAADARGREDWRSLALELARAAAAASLRHPSPPYAGLCHGAAGLGHLFNRLAQRTGDPVLDDAARSWYRRLFELRHPEAGFARRLADGSVILGPGEAHLLSGSVGIALALLAAASSAEPTWDRLFLLSQ